LSFKGVLLGYDCLFLRHAEWPTVAALGSDAGLVAAATVSARTLTSTLGLRERTQVVVYAYESWIVRPRR
jgi:hypothetical protein